MFAKVGVALCPVEATWFHTFRHQCLSCWISLVSFGKFPCTVKHSIRFLFLSAFSVHFCRFVVVCLCFTAVKHVRHSWEQHHISIPTCHVLHIILIIICFSLATRISTTLATTTSTMLRSQGHRWYLFMTKRSCQYPWIKLKSAYQCGPQSPTASKWTFSSPAQMTGVS